MTPRTALWLVNALGGMAVLGSYFHGLSSPHASNGGIWGGVPESAQTLYTVSMLAAATGYFPFTYLFAFHADPERAKFLGKGLPLVTTLYAFVLFPSAMWLPLTAWYLDAPTPGGWLAIKLTLAAVALASLGLLACVVRMEPKPPRALRIAAIVGCTCFCFQTVVLDASVWVWMFPV